MIRHSSSFLFSLLFHGTVFILLVYTYKNIPAIEKVKSEKKVCIKLCNVAVKPTVVKPIQKPKSKKIIKPKPTPKPKPKKIIKPKPKPKPVVKIVKPMPVVVPKVEEEPVVEMPKEPIVEPTKVMPDIAKEEFVEDVEVVQQRAEKDYLQEHLAQIAKLLQENLYYPRRARKRGVVGEVMIKFKLATDASVHSIEIVSSNSDILSRAAIKTIQDLSGEFPKPNEELALEVPINYKLK